MSAQSFAIPEEFKDVFNAFEARQYATQFRQFDADASGTIDLAELRNVFDSLNEKVSDDTLRKYIQEVDLNSDNKIDWPEFIAVAAAVRRGGKLGSSGLARAQVQHMNRVQGELGAVHSYSDEERAAFAEHLNSMLGDDADLANYLPMDPTTDDLFTKTRDGVVFCKYINSVEEGTVDLRAVNMKPKSKFEIIENQNLVINSCKGIGCVVVNVRAADLHDGKEHLVLGLVWQLIKKKVLQKVSLKSCPELVVLLREGEELADLLKLSSEDLLLRWVNYHLEKAGVDRRIANFSRDISDSVAYAHLLKEISKGACDTSPLGVEDLRERAEHVLQQAEKIDCRKFVTPSQIVQGNAKLNLAFVATLFNTYPALEIPPEAEVDLAELLEEDENASREERAYRNWLNSLGLSIVVNSLFDDARDGLVILEAFDKIRPGIVDWRQVNKVASNKWKKTENCNYCVVLGKQCKFSLVNICGSDIVDGNKKLILGLVWQLMRMHTLSVIESLASDGKSVGEEDIIRWCNDKVASRSAGVAAISSFRDPSLRTGVYFIQLLAAVDPRVINWDLVTAGDTDQDAEMNAKYVISIARKLGCCIFLLWEDIVEVKAKMMMTLAGSIMGLKG